MDRVKFETRRGPTKPGMISPGNNNFGLYLRVLRSWKRRRWGGGIRIRRRPSPERLSICKTLYRCLENHGFVLQTRSHLWRVYGLFSVFLPDAFSLVRPFHPIVPLRFLSSYIPPS